MRIFYIVGKMDQDFGGGVINHRNLELLRATCCDVEVFQFEQYKVPFWQRLKERVHGVNGGVSRLNIEEIIIHLREHPVDLVFIAHSLYGCIVKRVKDEFPQLPIVTFLHNVEVRYAWEMFKNNVKSMGNLLNIFFVYRAEKLAVKYSDYLIALNNRDAKQILDIYKKDVTALLPTSFRDSGEAKKEEDLDELKYLFVGSDFFANIQGITWFVQEVMPYVDGKLFIVGKGMEKAVSHLISDRVQVIGYVQSLKEWYAKVDIVVCPLFLGSGMKTKTAEAMMYGKAIVGTPEAFEGYDIDTRQVGGCSVSAQDMITILNDLGHNKERLLECQRYAREMFLKNYSMTASMVEMRLFLEKVICCHSNNGR
ncbi:glycosyltransferase [Butyricimonas paravirosa]|uniref:glycosyltransferase n=1 Tax=Butyricimonas paravirosa TaxID=1472417 RepID=UPI0022E0D93A|nr:glycosyltransferase [Butyricimonas paravirosa]